MDKEGRIELYRKAISKWGEEAQVRMVYEELGELLTAIARFYRGRASYEDVMTELADVSIMVEQIATMMDYEDFETEKENKLTRLKEKLEK